MRKVRSWEGDLSHHSGTTPRRVPKGHIITDSLCPATDVPDNLLTMILFVFTLL